MAKGKVILTVPKPRGNEAVYYEDGTREVRKASKRGRPAKPADDAPGDATQGDDTEA